MTNSLVYECDVEWLRPLTEGDLSVSKPVKLVKWQKLEDVSVVGVEYQGGNRSMQRGDTVIYRMLVGNGGAYKGWVEVRRSGVRNSYGLFAISRFEKGSIITAKIPDEIEGSNLDSPTKDTLFLGWNWVVRKSAEELGPTTNAVYLKESGLIRACTRIMPGTEILLDGDKLSGTNGLEWLDALVFLERSNGWKNWHARNTIGRVVSGDRGRGYIVKYQDGTVRNMDIAELRNVVVVKGLKERNSGNIGEEQTVDKGESVDHEEGVKFGSVYESVLPGYVSAAFDRKKRKLDVEET